MLRRFVDAVMVSDLAGERERAEARIGQPVQQRPGDWAWRAFEKRLRLAFATEVTEFDGIRAESGSAALREVGEVLRRELGMLAVLLGLDDSSEPIRKDERDERRLARMLLLGRWYERGCPESWISTDPADGLEAMLETVPDDEVATMLRLFWRTDRLAELRTGARSARPRLAGARDVGGVAPGPVGNGLLLGLGTAAPDEDELRVLLAQALLDYPDQHRLDRIGWYEAAGGVLLRWELDAMLRGELDQIRAALRRLAEHTRLDARTNGDPAFESVLAELLAGLG